MYYLLLEQYAISTYNGIKLAHSCEKFAANPLVHSEHCGFAAKIKFLTRQIHIGL